MFTQLKATYEGSGSYIRANTGEVISWDSFNSKGFRFEWYVFKYESGDCWHVDGRIIDKSTDLPIGIIDPDEKADEEKAACVRYDVETGRFVPGFMDTKLNRPHSWAKGDNDTEIVKGFDDVYYTVLDEDTFAQNNNIIPTKLMDAAETINTLASARLASLSEDTQYQYGRIDSQAWKKEYIKRNDKGTLWMTPYITEELENAGVTREDYIWLAMGDTTGHITTIWVMDRDMAGIENLVEGE